jgi:hypothetical protein
MSSPLLPADPEEAARLKRLLAVMPMFLEAFKNAQRFSVEDRPQFSVTLQRALGIGLCRVDLRWIVEQKFFDHTEEIWEVSKKRMFTSVPLLAIGERSCFMLTQTGSVFAQKIVGQTEAKLEQTDKSFEKPCPHWDHHSKELTLGGKLVKKFRRPAEAQELILECFQEDKWPVSIYNPFPNSGKLKAVERLHNAIKRLNGKQREEQIVFWRGENGEKVYWGV